MHFVLLSDCASAQIARCSHVVFSCVWSLLFVFRSLSLPIISFTTGRFHELRLPSTICGHHVQVPYHASMSCHFKRTALRKYCMRLMDLARHSSLTGVGFMMLGSLVTCPRLLNPCLKLVFREFCSARHLSRNAEVYSES